MRYVCLYEQEWPGLGDPQLSKSNSEPWELRSIEQAIEDLGHLDKVITVLKIDVEGDHHLNIFTS